MLGLPIFVAARVAVDHSFSWWSDLMTEPLLIGHCAKPLRRPPPVRKAEKQRIQYLAILGRRGCGNRGVFYFALGQWAGIIAPHFLTVNRHDLRCFSFFRCADAGLDELIK